MHTRVKKALILLFLLSLFGACALDRGRYVPAPSLIQGTKAEMNTPGFWIGLLENPDKILPRLLDNLLFFLLGLFAVQFLP